MSSQRPQRREMFECPHCGADVPVGAKVCHECGSDASTGWQAESEVDYASEDLPTGYSKDRDHPGTLQSRALPPWVVVTAIVVVLAVLALTVLR